MNKHYFNIQNINIWYNISSPTSSGTPVIVIHGGPGADYIYLQPLEALSENRPVVFYNQAGCGNSDSLNDKLKWNLDYFTNELKLLIDSLNYDRVFLLGQSWGTSIATNYLIKYNPENVAALVLSAPCLNSAQWAMDQQKWIDQMDSVNKSSILNASLANDFTTKSYQDAVNKFYELHVCRLEAWPDCLLETFEGINLPMYNAMWGPSEFHVTGTLKNMNLEPGLALIDVPVLITCGEFDEATPETCHKYASLMKNAEVYIVPGASHEHHLEQPELYLTAVNDFIERIDTRNQ